MAKGSCHSPDSLLEEMLGPASHSPPCSSDPHRGTGHRCQCRCSTPYFRCPSHNSRCKGQILKYSDPTVDEPAEYSTVVVPEPATSIPPDSTVFAECPVPRRLRFGPLFQMWHEWSFCSLVSQQAICSRSREPFMTSRAAELCLQQGQPCDYQGSSTSSRHCTGYVLCKLTPCNSFI
jgi:hypothetical protein